MIKNQSNGSKISISVIGIVVTMIILGASLSLMGKKGGNVFQSVPPLQKWCDRFRNVPPKFLGINVSAFLSNIFLQIQQKQICLFFLKQTIKKMAKEFARSWGANWGASLGASLAHGRHGPSGVTQDSGEQSSEESLRNPGGV